jgi:aconitate hydratase
MNVESTPEMARSIYAGMERNLEIIRSRVSAPLTLADKILYGHLHDAKAQELDRGRSYLLLQPDRLAFQDVLGQTAMLQFMQTKRDTVAVPTTIHCDHLIEARSGERSDLADSIQENREVYEFLRSAAARYGAGFWEPGAGIIHQVILENYAFPGELIIGTDSHTPNAGGLGAAGIGVGGADAVEVIAGLPWELLNPKRIAVFLTGSLGGWTSPKDVIMWVAGALGVSGGTNAIVEYIGPGACTISATGKATITNMGAELGATTSLFPFDEQMSRYLVSTNRGELAIVAKHYERLLVPDEGAEGDPERAYDRVLRLNLSELEPFVVGPHSPDVARPISQFAKEIRESGFPEQLSAALIGSCTNSSYEDMTRAADIAEQAIANQIRATVPFFVTPGSAQIKRTIERDGQLAVLARVGGTVLANACGPCIGQWNRSTKGVPNSIVTSYNRNFAGRNDGNSSTMNFIASPEVVTALALAGRLTFNPLRDSLPRSDGTSFRLAPPAADHSPLPSAGFVRDLSQRLLPPVDRAGIKIKINPNSERLQALQPWPARNGHDFIGLPVLIKTAGKTTTDQISPAGKWLKYRGHLERFSENLLSGAKNAFTGEVGKTEDIIAEETGLSVATVANRYRSKGVQWVVVGDTNYGEGSSREHAALSPRLLGGVAVIARSFARIHETNLKKQGLLALTFSDPGDYNRIRQGDRVSLVDLQELSQGSSVKCVVTHRDGRSELLLLRHSYTDGQFGWFRAGSALNTMV